MSVCVSVCVRQTRTHFHNTHLLLDIYLWTFEHKAFCVLRQVLGHWYVWTGWIRIDFFHCSCCCCCYSCFFFALLFTSCSFMPFRWCYSLDSLFIYLLLFSFVQHILLVAAHSFFVFLFHCCLSELFCLYNTCSALQYSQLPYILYVLCVLHANMCALQFVSTQYYFAAMHKWHS